MTTTAPVLLLAPSHGLGGGIERYIQAVQSALDTREVTYQRLDLARSGPSGHRLLLAEASAALDGMGKPARVVLGHPALLPLTALLARARPVGGISVICHGSDVWAAWPHPRWQLERWLMRRRDVRIVAVSSFTAGTLFRGGQAVILPPGLSGAWFSQLVSAANSAPARPPGLKIMTAFRLADWQEKGLRQLVAAVATLGRADTRLTVCGSGDPPPALLRYIGNYPWASVRTGLSDPELAAQFAMSDLFVLATRTRTGPRPYGEGFGLVLLEAQVAGVGVIGPAYGGSLDAYLDGVSGATPRDESVMALTHVLADLLREPARLRDMGARGAVWARERFAPGCYAALVVERLL